MALEPPGPLKAMPIRLEGRRLVANLALSRTLGTTPAESPGRRRRTARHSRRVTLNVTSRMTRAEAFAEAARVFEQLGITAAALYLAERTGSCFTDPTDAMDADAGMAGGQ